MNIIQPVWYFEIYRGLTSYSRSMAVKASSREEAGVIIDGCLDPDEWYPTSDPK